MILTPTRQHCMSRVKAARDTAKERALLKATNDGDHLTKTGIVTGMTGNNQHLTLQTIMIRESGHNNPKERDEEKTPLQQTLLNGSTLRLCGAKSTKNPVIRPIGASTTPTELVVRPPTLMDCGATRATAQAIPLLPASPALFESLIKEKGSGKKEVKELWRPQLEKSELSRWI